MLNVFGERKECITYWFYADITHSTLQSRASTHHDTIHEPPFPDQPPLSPRGRSHYSSILEKIYKTTTRTRREARGSLLHANSRPNIEYFIVNDDSGESRRRFAYISIRPFLSARPSASQPAQHALLSFAPDFLPIFMVGYFHAWMPLALEGARFLSESERARGRRSYVINRR